MHNSVVTWSSLELVVAWSRVVAWRSSSLEQFDYYRKEGDEKGRDKGGGEAVGINLLFKMMAP